MIRTFQYRLYPSAAQDAALDFLLWQGRNLYNAALEQRITTYRETGKGLSYPQQWAHFRDLRHEQPETLGRLNATCIQQLLRRLDKSFTAFFRRIKEGGKPGFPRFKGRHRFHSLEFQHGDGCQLRGLEERPVFYVQNVGELKLEWHRPLPEGAQIQHVVLKRSLGRWYVNLQLEIPAVEAPVHQGPAVGIDVGLTHLLSCSDGTVYENPHWLRRSLQKLRRAQRRLSRRRKGSQRWRQAAFHVAQVHEQIARQRRDLWHQTSRQLVDTYSVIGVEDLTLGFMTQNHHLALSAHDAALGMLRPMLAYKAESAGCQVVAVDPRGTSQRCSSCGRIVRKALRCRVHRCPHCGWVEDRDTNAARNILRLTLEALGRSVQAVTWAEVGPCVA
jgi:putative transposase